MQAYLRRARSLLVRAPQAVREEVACYVEHARRQIDQIDRRVLQGETIPHAEKVLSIFEPHTRWCAKQENSKVRVDRKGSRLG